VAAELPAAPAIELPEHDQKPVRGCVDMGGQGGDLVAQLLDGVELGRGGMLGGGGGLGAGRVVGGLAFAH
jgi:hypothetical protein